MAEQLLEHRFLAKLDPARGRLRAYLKTALNHQLSNDREKNNAQRRGGAQVRSSLPLEQVEPFLKSDSDTPDRVFERSWAQSVFQRAIRKLEHEFQREGRQGPLVLLGQYFSGAELPPYHALAKAHRMTVPQLKSFLHRARGRFRELVRAELADTVTDPKQVDLELAELVDALQ